MCGVYLAKASHEPECDGCDHEHTRDHDDDSPSHRVIECPLAAEEAFSRGRAE